MHYFDHRIRKIRSVKTFLINRLCKIIKQPASATRTAIAITWGGSGSKHIYSFA